MTRVKSVIGEWWPAIALAAALVLPACSKTSPTAPTTGIPSAESVVASGTVVDPADGPIEGALVTARGLEQGSAVTDAAGRFAIGPLRTYKSTPLGLVVNRAGYLHWEATWKLTDVGNITIRLTPLLPLSIPGSTTSELLPTDPSTYVGEPYESQYSWNTKDFEFTTPPNDDVVVELSADSVGSAALAMWALAGTLVSQPSGTRQVLHLPPGTGGILLVGRPYDAGKLTEAVPFVLETRLGAPEE